MNNRFMINYIPGTTPLHRLNGATKVIGFFVMILFIIMTFDIRLMACMFVFSFACIISMKPNWKPIIFAFCFMTIMAGVIGSLLVVLVRPSMGLSRVGGETFIIRWNDRFYLTWELVWYLLVFFVKRLTSLAAALVFILSITPSELAAGLNTIGLPYKACTIISLAFRTIPDIARDFVDIKNSLALRGVELDRRKSTLIHRLKQMVLILVPLIMSSFDRVDTIANAMDLRGFGKNKKRTWYSENPPRRIDWIVRICFALLALYCVYYLLWRRIIHPPVFEYWCPWINPRIK